VGLFSDRGLRAFPPSVPAHSFPGCPLLWFFLLDVRGWSRLLRGVRRSPCPSKGVRLSRVRNVFRLRVLAFFPPIGKPGSWARHLCVSERSGDRGDSRSPRLVPTLSGFPLVSSPFGSTERALRTRSPFFVAPFERPGRVLMVFLSPFWDYFCVSFIF